MLKRTYRKLTSIFLFAVVGAGSVQAEDVYKLGPQDRLQVNVSDLRAGTGEAYQWQAFTGEFTVGPSGRVSLPVIGEIAASGKTTTDLSGEIASRLQGKAGLATKPDASVQIVKFRPFYVMGTVEKPGEYDFRPQLSVLQAVSLAGGLQRVPTDALLRFVREALMSRGDIKELTATRFALIARQARLDAEIKDGLLTFPEELQSRAREPEIDRILREETQAFETRKAAIHSQIVNLNQTKDFLADQIKSLGAKDATTAQQLELMKQELARITGLVVKGLSAMPRQLEASQTTAQLESNRLDAQIAVIRARQDIAKADRDVLDLKDSRRTVAFQELAETRIKLSETEAKLEAANNLLYQAEQRSPMTIVETTDAYAKPDYFIFRRGPDKAETIPAAEEDLVQPGDVVRVQPRMPQTQSGQPVASNGARRSLRATDF